MGRLQGMSNQQMMKEIVQTTTKTLHIVKNMSEILVPLVPYLEILLQKSQKPKTGHAHVRQG